MQQHNRNERLRLGLTQILEIVTGLLQLETAEPSEQSDEPAQQQESPRAERPKTLVVEIPTRNPHRLLVLAASREWMSAKALARRAGYPYHGPLRQAIADLVRAGHLERGPDGIRRQW